MSITWRQLSSQNAGPRPNRRNGHPPTAAPSPPPDEPTPASTGWDERVAHEARHQELIEATFDRAEAYERLGDFEQALEWLDRAAALGGGLPLAYRSRRALWARATARGPRPAAGDWKNRLGSAGEAAPGR
jgi:tetratricopeptide (TPR) repeat protein